jgi:CheY-like chemotaxis protein
MPESATLKDRRGSRRWRPRSGVAVECREPAQGPDQNLAAGFLDLSETGARLVLTQELKPGMEVEVLLPGDATTPIKRIATVIWTAAAGPDRHCTGLQFRSRLDYADVRRLAEQHILIVEDDAITREAMSMVLEGEGYAVTGAAHGREALDRLRQGPLPDLILLDLMMPVMDGWEFRAAQRQDPALAGIPVMVVSAASDAPQKAVALGAAGFLGKPVELDVLLDAVQRQF